jgi:hypothetical protein
MRGTILERSDKARVPASKRYWLDRHAGAVQAVFAGFILLATTLYVIFTIKLWGVTRKAAGAVEKERNGCGGRALAPCSSCRNRNRQVAEAHQRRGEVLLDVPDVLFREQWNSPATVIRLATGFGVGELVPPYPAPMKEWKIKDGLFISKRGDYGV